MGLIARARHLKKIDDFKEIFVEIFGMSVEEAKEKLSKADESPKKVEISEDVKAAIKQKNEQITSPEQLVEIFARETEEFYPDGNAPRNKH